jgi:hypothetical protein
MEIVLIAVVAVVLGGLIYVYNKNKTLDVNNDGKINAADVGAAVKVVAADVKAKADVNKDGKVNAADAKAVKAKAKAAVKKTTAKAKSAVEKATKPAAKKRQFKPKAK